MFYLISLHPLDYISHESPKCQGAKGSVLSNEYHTIDFLITERIIVCNAEGETS